MSTQIVRYNDGSKNAPRLRVHQALWGMSKLPFNSPVEWTLDEKFSRCKAAGFEAVECWLNDETEAEHKESLDRHGLRLVLGHRPFSVEQVKTEVARALRLKADFIFGQPADAFTPADKVAEICREGRKFANDAGIPYFIEIHRGNFTENLPQIKQLVELVPDIRFTADLSHLVVCGEFYGWEDEKAIERMACVIERTSHAHGRISNGEAVQVDVADGTTDPAKFFVRIWTAIFQRWLEGALPGDVFPFGSELGPPRYAITTPDGKEISDRWEQGLVMKRLAEQAWSIANKKD